MLLEPCHRSPRSHGCGRQGPRYSAPRDARRTESTLGKAGSLAPRLARSLTQYRGHIDRLPRDRFAALAPSNGVTARLSGGCGRQRPRSRWPAGGPSDARRGASAPGGRQRPLTRGAGGGSVILVMTIIPKNAGGDRGRRRSQAGDGASDAALRKVGLRLTGPRRVVLEVVRATDAHPTAETVHRMVRRRLPRVSLGTVYRNLRWQHQRAPSLHVPLVRPHPRCGRSAHRAPFPRPLPSRGGAGWVQRDPSPHRVLWPLRGVPAEFEARDPAPARVVVAVAVAERRLRFVVHP